jgi:hypothetical protein
MTFVLHHTSLAVLMGIRAKLSRYRHKGHKFPLYALQYIIFSAVLLFKKVKVCNETTPLVLSNVNAPILYR